METYKIALKKMMSLLTVLAMIIAGLGFLVSNPQDAYADTNVKTVKVTLIGQPVVKGTPKVYENVIVSSDAAEKRGYVDSENNSIEGITDDVTCMDALVVLHEKMYGDEFKEAPTDYLEFVKYEGYTGLSVKKIFGNDPNAMYYNSNVSIYPSNDLVAIKDGDVYRAYMMGDTIWWSDLYLYFSPDTYSAEEGETVELTLMEEGKDENWNPVVKPHEGRTVVLTSSDGKAIESSEKTDAEGKVVFEDLEAGEYIASVKAEGDDDYFVMPWAKVTVTAKPTTPTEDTPDNEITGETEETDSIDVTTEMTAAAKPENSPKTGDDFNAVPLIVIALCAAAVGGVTLIRRRPADK